jgi:hypothetical protein
MKKSLLGKGFVVIALVTLISGYATANCTLSPSSPKGTLISCTMHHQEFVGGILTRHYGVFIPNGYRPGLSGMILKVQGTTHRISSDCDTTPAVNETAGWLPFLQTVPAPAPVIVCPEGWFDTGPPTYDSGERWNAWGEHHWNWVNGVVPNDLDFLFNVVTAIQSALRLDTKFMAVTADSRPGSVMASNFAAVHSTIVSALVLYSDETFLNVTSSRLDTDGSLILPPPTPVSVLILTSPISDYRARMCGAPTQGKPLNVDDVFNYWALSVHPTNFIYLDPKEHNTNLCNGLLQTTLEVKIGNQGIDGTEVDVVKLVGSAKETPWCSFGLDGKVYSSICSPSDPPHNFMMPPATGLWTNPGNHYLTAPIKSMLQLEYNFMNGHRLP